MKLVWLSGPAWESAPTTPPPPPPPEDVMKSWSVDELARFMTQQDALGLANLLQTNAVNGSDLLAFESWEQIAEDLRATPFQSKKIWRLRGAFLDGRANVLENSR